ncbi:uncharacterized protein sS8_0726 [Methylocaldum marinum]|uniref:F1/F0 ATPase, Methanosarcina type, subunit 2 n=1 Tax=Methylocaldum marinum TaxID=1432792 RepID=A0A250KP01_9GAMM|nr:ATP synthase subunit I [Methylocaldum marinum]BBA32691.1 uncharacterized protein sS8_0726 [Methylocaldum marinum]
MTEPISESFLLSAFAFLGGGLLGALHFFWLWHATRNLYNARRPALWLLAGSIPRLAVVLCGFYLLSRGDPLRLTAALLGFLLARVIVIRRMRPPAGRGRATLAGDRERSWR